MLNEKMEKLGKEASAIRMLFEYGKKKKAEIGEENVYDFSIGNPSVDAPSVVKDTLIKLLNEEKPSLLHGYTSASGDINTRCEIAKYLNDKYSANVKGENIYLTCGAAASLAISFNALINKGDEVIVFAPFFPEYKVFIEKALGKVIVAKSDLKDFQIDFNDLEKKINKKTKIVVINSPNNPTGVVYTEETIVKLAKLLEEKSEKYKHPIYLLSDEPYRELVYSNIKYPFVTNYYDNSIICYSYSKSLSLPGERIGYVLVSTTAKDDKKIYNAICGAGRSLGFVCAPALFQSLIKYCQGVTSDLNVYKENLSDLYNMLSSIGYEVVKPDGAFYLFVKALEEDANKFSENAKKFNLLLVPSDSFGLTGYVRVAYCVTNAQIKASKMAFSDLYKFYKEEK